MKTLKTILIITICLICFPRVYGQNTPCNGKEYSTDSQFFRASASGSSMDATTSKKKALMKARTNIADAINKQFNNALNSQSNYDNALKAKLIGIMQIATRQEIAKMKIICENCNNVNQKVNCNLVVEVSKENIIKSFTELIDNDNALKGKIDSKQFVSILK